MADQQQFWTTFREPGTFFWHLVRRANVCSHCDRDDGVEDYVETFALLSTAKKKAEQLNKEILSHE